MASRGILRKNIFLCQKMFFVGLDMVREVGNGFPWHMVKKHIFRQNRFFVTKSEENRELRCEKSRFYKEIWAF